MSMAAAAAVDIITSMSTITNMAVVVDIIMITRKGV